MQPNDPIVGGIVLRRVAIQSPNFAEGVTGWSINQDGSAEFSNVTIVGGELILESGSTQIKIGPGPTIFMYGPTYFWEFGFDSSGSPFLQAGKIGDTNPNDYASINIFPGGGSSLGLTVGSGIGPSGQGGIGVSDFSTELQWTDPTDTDQWIITLGSSGILIGGTGLIVNPARIYITTSPNRIQVTTAIFATGPYTGVAEVWHTAGLGSGWSGTLQYRLMPDGDVELRGSASNGSGSVNGVPIMSVPSLYAPALNGEIPISRPGQYTHGKLTVQTSGTFLYWPSSAGDTVGSADLTGIRYSTLA